MPRRASSGRHRACQLLRRLRRRTGLGSRLGLIARLRPVLRLRRVAGFRLFAWLSLLAGLRFLGRLGFRLIRRVHRVQHRSIQPLVGLVHLSREDLLERTRRFELFDEFVDVFGRASEDDHAHPRRTAVDAGTHRHEHHVRRQRRLEMIEERRPRERPLIDQRVRFTRRSRDDGELFGVDALADARRLAPQAVAIGPIAPDSRRQIGVLSREFYELHGIEERDAQDDHARQGDEQMDDPLVVERTSGKVGAEH